MALSKADIFNDKDDLVVQSVAVPEWGGDVYVRGLTGNERDAYEAGLIRVGSNGKVETVTAQARGRLAAIGLCDEKGRRLFTDDDARQLGDKNAAALGRICDRIRKLSGMDAEAIEEAKGN